MDAKERSLIFFHDPAFGLDDAARLLAARGLTLEQDSDQLEVRWSDGLVLRVQLARGLEVRDEAQRVGQGTPYETALGDCDARFAISFDDLNEVLDEINTLIEVQATLQGATGGFLYNTWNQRLSPPES